LIWQFTFQFLIIFGKYTLLNYFFKFIKLHVLFLSITMILIYLVFGLIFYILLGHYVFEFSSFFYAIESVILIFHFREKLMNINITKIFEF